MITKAELNRLAILREAAHILREQAAKATPGSWTVRQEIDGVYAGMATVVRSNVDAPRTSGRARRIVTVGQTRQHDAEHAEGNVAWIALMGPTVAEPSNMSSQSSEAGNRRVK